MMTLWTVAKDKNTNIRPRKLEIIGLFAVQKLGTVWQSMTSPRNEVGSLHTHIHGICEIFPLYSREERRNIWKKRDRGTEMEMD